MVEGQEGCAKRLVEFVLNPREVKLVKAVWRTLVSHHRQIGWAESAFDLEDIS